MVNARATQLIFISFLFSLNAFSKDHPLVLAPSRTNIVELPSGTEKIWLNIPGEPPQSQNLVGIGTNRFAIYFSRDNFKGRAVEWVKTPRVAGCRWLENGKWSSISPLVTDALPLRTNLLFPCGVVGFVESGQTVRLPFSIGNTFELSEIRFEVVANRIGSQLDPVMRIVDVKGRESARCDDDAAAGRDARIAFHLKGN